MVKNYITSKTLWLNIIALIAIITAGQFDFVLDGVTQAAILVVINMVLRVITKEELVWNTTR